MSPPVGYKSVKACSGCPENGLKGRRTSCQLSSPTPPPGLRAINPDLTCSMNTFTAGIQRHALGGC